MRESQGSRSKTSFKKTIDANDARRHRGALQDLERKNKRAEQVAQRRRMVASSSAGDGVAVLAALGAASSQSTEELSLADLNAGCVAALHSDQFLIQFQTVRRIRKLLSIEQDPPIDRVIELGLVPVLLDLLVGVGVAPITAEQQAQWLQMAEAKPEEQQLSVDRLEFEAAWALTNVASGNPDQTKAVVQAGGIERFIAQLAAPNEDLRDQCVWALGNIAGDGAALRDLCLGMGALAGIMSQFTDTASQGLLRNSTWALSNLCRGKPPPPIEALLPAFPLLARLLQFPDSETATDAAWAWSYLSDGPDERIEALCQTPGVLPRLVELMSVPPSEIAGSSVVGPAVRTPALRAVGNVVTGSASQTQAVVDLNPFPALLAFMGEKKRKQHRKEACWTVSNITAGTQAQVQAVIDADIFPVLSKMMWLDVHVVRKEACWAVVNATSGGSASQIRAFVSDEVLGGLVALAGSQNGVGDRLLIAILEAFDNIFRAGEVDTNTGSQFGESIYLDSFENHGGVELLDELLNHNNEKVFDMAQSLLDMYFPDDTDGFIGDSDTLLRELAARVDGAGAGGFAGSDQTPQSQQGNPSFQFNF